jgi:hypothetical protein
VRFAPPAGHALAVTDIPEDLDVAIAEHVTAIRDRFGLDGLRQAEQFIDAEIEIFEKSYQELAEATEHTDVANPAESASP